MPETQDETAKPGFEDRAALVGGQPALIERFGIRGLYGYRDISLSTKHAATILIARNGTGKTTLLGALDAFLKLDIPRFRELSFTEIFCRLRGMSEDLVLRHDDVVSFLQSPVDGEIGRLVSRTGIDGQKLFDFLLSGYRAHLANWLDDDDYNSITNVAHRAFSNDTLATSKAFDDAYNSLFKQNPNINSIKLSLDAALVGYEIVYLPTYRRIEAALTQENGERTRRGRIAPKPNFSAAGLHTADIQFGLGDISARLSELNSEIIKRSIREYRKISENIIDELIRGYEVSDDAEIPKPVDLKLFFSRLQSGSKAIGPQYSRISAPDFERIYSSEGVPPESAKFLKYFLNKLNGIIQITKEIEQPVAYFIRSCNRYLSSLGPIGYSSDEASHPHLENIDGKLLKLNPTNFSVHVESFPGQPPVSLDALSSGEKQMVSLFAKMSLYPKKKIVLIDEPELSLSIDWQRGILVDILLSPNFEQVIAITHSPFIFDNVLEPYARTLEFSVRQPPEIDLRLGLEATDFGWNGSVE